ncbi:MAG: glycine zipper 2TM domain-containing protein [Sulfurisoma sp.]|nr:glycine zipper 2TM domain-containing protein [Sulfurisoma sp.]
MENNRPTLHPALMIAAASVTALSLAGVGVLTGVIPFGHKSADPASQLQSASVQPAAVAQPAAVTPPAAQAPTVAVNVNTTPAPAAARPAAPKPVRVARNEPSDIEVYRAPAQMRTSTPVYTPQAPAICHDCGTIESVREVVKQSDGSGVGAVAGGVLGGVLGNQVGQGRGRDLATVVGVIGGAVAGNQIEKAQKRVVEYQVTVRFEDGTSRVFTQQTAPAWRSGDRIKVENDLLIGRA